MAEPGEDAANGLFSALSSSAVCTAVHPAGVLCATDCKVQPHPCERKTLETVRELAGNALCWRGSRGMDAVLAALCPFSRFVHSVWGQRSSAFGDRGWELRPPRPSA
ncbi:hypothetical protein MC885_011677 [Smutsia gigantea]|nr:hypothetical protein MC885_011677 [Smutsia gigantea]